LNLQRILQYAREIYASFFIEDRVDAIIEDCNYLSTEASSRFFDELFGRWRADKLRNSEMRASYIRKKLVDERCADLQVHMANFIQQAIPEITHIIADFEVQATDVSYILDGFIRSQTNQPLFV